MDKLLKSPHSTHTDGAVLITVAALGATVDHLGPYGVAIVLGGTPIVVINKTTNDSFLQIQ